MTGRWVTITPLDPAIAAHLTTILGVAADLARDGNELSRLRCIQLKVAHDEIRRNLTESYPDEGDAK